MSEETKELFKKFGFEIITKEINDVEVIRSYLVITPFSFYNGDPLTVCVVEYKDGLLLTDFGCVEGVLKKTGLADDAKNKTKLQAILSEHGAFNADIHKNMESEIGGFFEDKDFRDDFFMFSRLLMRISAWIETTVILSKGEKHV